MLYFGEETSEDCGICSVCLAKTSSVEPTDLSQIRQHIISALEVQALNSRALTEQLHFNDADVLKVLKLLLEHDIIRTTASNTYKLNR